MGEIDLNRISDQPQREAARDPGRSWIVQAPAGSGKTELLTQRYLRLLATVDHPEEILAVTFTRKAAAEMRNRIINSMYPAAGEKPPRDETLKIAAAALQRDREKGWNLEQYPARLRIRTIDSVNSWLSGTAPLAGQGRAATVSESPDELYRTAAARVVEAAGDAVRDLLIHLDNSSDKLVRLVAGMLGRRDQWLGITVGIGQTDGATARATLEGLLHELVAGELQAAAATLSPAQKEAVLKYLHFAAVNLVAKDADSQWREVLEMDSFPEPNAGQLSQWLWVAEFLLISPGSGGTVRKSLNVNNGFPPGAEHKLIKQEAVEFLKSFDDPACIETAFGTVRELPAPHYTDEQWRILESLLEVLHLAAGELQTVFAERGETDYPAIAQSALNALLDAEEGPTDLALRLDFRIRHILVDEFQDTSSAQLKLLQALTAGWSAGDGRTLFIVGDPMQSIYRFRKAEVGLFIDLQRNGLPNIKLEPLVLETNFRSDPRIIDWVNRVFAQIMPAAADLTSGAVSFSPSNAACIAEQAAGVEVHGLLKPSRAAEAERVADLVAAVLAADDKQDVAVLVRSRKHAELIATQLQQRGISFSGTGLENSVEMPVLQDLMCITRALSHRADRTAWLALLRAPWCGLSLADLERLAGQDQRSCIWDLLLDAAAFQRLSRDGQQRAQRLIDVIAPVFARRGPLPLRDVVEGVWAELGGPACLSDPLDLGRAEAFFDLLDDLDQGGDCPDAFDLHAHVAARLKPEDRKARVNLMTIHKAKGLEFDTVILPALEAGTRGDDKPVLAWQEVVTPAGDPGLVIAPIERTGSDKEAIFEFARRIDRRQAAFEQDRLLYVAATRARKNMHLFMGLGYDKHGAILPPASNSLAGRLWPAIGAEVGLPADASGTQPDREAWRHPTIRRCAADWQVPSAPANYAVPAPVAADERMREVTYDWASPVAQHVGTVVHRWLERITHEGAEHYDEKRLHGLRDRFAQMLRSDGLRDADLARGTQLVIQALVNTLADEQGLWLLDKSHAESAVELPVTFMRDNRMRAIVVDRTFVDEEGVRWIVDYKTSSHEGGGLEDFFAEEERRYSDQLNAYKTAMQLLEPDRPIQVALYFPLLQTLRRVNV